MTSVVRLLSDQDVNVDDSEKVQNAKDGSMCSSQESQAPSPASLCPPVTPSIASTVSPRSRKRPSERMAHRQSLRRSNTTRSLKSEGSRAFSKSRSIARLEQAELEDLAAELTHTQHVKVMEQQSSSGVLADYIERCKAADNSWRLTNERYLYYYLHSRPNTFLGEAGQHATGLLLREQLESDLMCSIVAERKKEGVMPPTGLSDFIAQVRNIQNMKSTLATITASIHNWEMNVKMLEFGYKDDQDVVLTRLEDRRQLHESFWSMYHDRARDERKERSLVEEAHIEGGYETLARFSSAVEQQLWAAEHRCPGAQKKVTSSFTKLPVKVTQELRGLENQTPSASRWKLRPCSAQVQRAQAVLRDVLLHRPASAGALRTCQKELPGLERPKPILPERKDMIRSMSSRPTSAGSVARSRARPSSAGSWSTLPSRPQSAAVGRLRHLTHPDKRVPLTEKDLQPMSCEAWPATPQRSRRPQTAPNTRHVPSSCRKYLQECHQRATVPDTIDFNTGLSSKLLAQRRGFTDHDLLAITGMLQDREHMEEINLRENLSLTDAGIVPFFEQLAKGEHLMEHLRKMDFKLCKGMGCRSLESLLRLLPVARHLREINVSGVQLGMKLQLRFCETLGAHPSLTFMSLARVGLGGHCLTGKCLRHLFGSATNKKLDLSWNVFNKQEFQVMGDYVDANLSLEHLLLDNCAGYTVRKDTPISELVEKLAFNKALRSLSVCTNRIDSRAALVIEDSLEGHPRLSRLYLRNNPLGIMGLRSILRLLCREQSRLSRLDIEGCHGGKSGDEVVSETSQVFSFTNPGGKYVLDLTIPYDRSLCRMLYETAERFELDHSKAFVNIHYSKPPYQHPIRDSIGQYKVRRDGILTFTFNVESAIAAKWSEIADDDFVHFLNSHLEMMRFTPHRIKMRPLLANWKAISGMHLEQETFLSALASDFNMILPYLEYMVRACPEASNQTIFRLIPSLRRDGISLFAATALFRKMEDLLLAMREMEAFMLFNPQNPTGHYKLKLENSTDFAVAQQLLLLDRWESVVNKRRGRHDVSQRGNQSQMRNECYMGRSLHLSVKLLTEWVMPEFGEFECDYVTSTHPKQGSKPLSDELWESLMMAMYDSPCAPADRLKVLKTISHQIFLSSLHIRQMVGFFRSDADREEALVFFWPRLVDKYNAKVFRVRFEKQEDIVRLQGRLGYVSFFPFIQPENAVFRLNLNVYEERLAASLYVTLMLRESPGNIKDPFYQKPDGSIDNLVMGVPRSWADWKQCPSEGIFSGRYTCAPENRDVNFRRRLAETYGYYDSKIMAGVTEQDIKWWTGLTEPPPDVLDLLEFMISRFQNCDEAFWKIVGLSDVKTQLITLRNFSAALKAMECGKFKGADETQRLQAIFRYLDPGGEGSISFNEWRVLGQLWNEFDLTIREFVQFLQIAFGEDLQDAWSALDDDGSGELSEQEWDEAVAKIGYFGPSRVIFALLDGSDDGDISVTEFEVLEKYKPPPKEEP
ncbi:unnamed protein product [Effrenium voratum]|nr:unnamed protein product [Effrenium voratum]